MYYSSNFSEVQTVINTFDENDAASIESAKKLLQNPKLSIDLCLIFTHYRDLPILIRSLEDTHLMLSQKFEILEKCLKIVNSVKTDIGQRIKNKMNAVVAKNTGLEKIKKISEALFKNQCLEEISEPGKLSSFKYAPITSVDVERSFSSYKNIFRDNRQNFLFENLKKYLIIYCNNKF